jgi:hypothetical protein
LRQIRAFQRHRLILLSHPNIHVLRLDAHNYDSSMKKAHGKLPLVEDLVKACAFIKAAKNEWIKNNAPGGQAIAQQHKAEMKPFEVEAKAQLVEIRKQQELDARAVSGAGGAAVLPPGSRIAPSPATPTVSPPATHSSSTPVTPAAAAAAASCLPLLMEITDPVYEVSGDPYTYWWPVVVRAGVLSPGANVRLKSTRDVLFIGTLKGRSIMIKTPQGELVPAEKVVPGVGAGLLRRACAVMSHAMPWVNRDNAPLDL